MVAAAAAAVAGGGPRRRLYDWNLSIWQMEVSLTQIFDRPLRGREFFEEVIRNNLDLGRPDRVQLVFDRVVTKKTLGEFRTRVIQDGVHPSLHIQYKNFDLKQYFKEGRGCRTEGTFRNPKDFGINKGLSNLPYLRKIGCEINRRLLEVAGVSHNSGLSGNSIQRVVQPTVTADGEKAPALKFGQPRVMALLLALTLFQHLIDGFHNRDLRGLVADLLGVTAEHYTAGQMTYDLRRLPLKGLISGYPGATGTSSRRMAGRWHACSRDWRRGSFVPLWPCSPPMMRCCRSRFAKPWIAWTATRSVDL